jgi:hypothetical protein
MDKEKFIHCCGCDTVHRITPFDKAPTHVFSANEIKEQATDDWRSFMDQHAGHRLESLRGTGEKFFASGLPSDPMSVAYIEVSNGHKQFLVRRKRESIQEPWRYELVRGRLAHAAPTLEAQANEIKREMKNHFSWGLAARPEDDKIEFFASVVQDVVKTLDPSSVAISEYSYVDDTVSYGLFDSAAINAVMERSAPSFDPVQLEAIRRFVDTHRRGCDVMTIVIRRQSNIERAAG